MFERDPDPLSNLTSVIEANHHQSCSASLHLIIIASIAVVFYYSPTAACCATSEITFHSPSIATRKRSQSRSTQTVDRSRFPRVSLSTIQSFKGPGPYLHSTMSSALKRLSSLASHFAPSSSSPTVADNSKDEFVHSFHTHQLSPTLFLPRAASIEPEVWLR